jgi:hypothetical protein
MSVILSDYEAGLTRFMNTEFSYNCCMCDKENVAHMIAFGVNVQHYCDIHWEEARKGIIGFFDEMNKKMQIHQINELKKEIETRLSEIKFNEKRIEEIKREICEIYHLEQNK